jgi:hypothetical protein
VKGLFRIHRIAVLGFACLVAVLAAAPLTAKDVKPPAHPTSLARLESKAKTAKATTDLLALRELVDEVFIATGLLGDAATSLRLRVTNAERIYRVEGRFGVSQETLTNSLNTTVNKYRLDPTLRTTQAQLALYRGLIARHVPSIAARTPRLQGVAAEMAPAESVLIAGSLIFQKLRNPEYQVTPEQWVNQTLQRRRIVRTPKVPIPHSVTRNIRVVKGREAGLLNMAMLIQQGVAKDGGEIVSEVHLFLHLLGLPR